MMAVKSRFVNLRALFLTCFANSVKLDRNETPQEATGYLKMIMTAKNKIHGGVQMKKIAVFFKLILAIAITFVAIAAANAAGPHKVITGAELEAMMKNKTPIVIVDVRERELYAKGHIPGAINIPYDTARPRILKELKSKDTIVFVCHGGPMGDELGEILTSNGYNSVYNLKSGMRRWSGPIAASK